VKLKLQLSRRTAWIIFVILVLLLVAGTTMPNELKSEIEGHFWKDVPWAALAHYTLFTLIALCPVYGTGRSATWRIVLLAVVLAVATELLQSLVPGRHPQSRDLLIDLAGTATALLLRKMLPELSAATFK
jgi:VanZ family protein